MNTKVTKTIFATIAMICFHSTIGIPTLLYFLNPEEFIWRGFQWLLFFFISVFISLLVCFPILALLSKYFRKYIEAVNLILLVGLSYIITRHYFLPVQYGLLDGSLKPKLNITQDFSLLVSLLIIVFFAIFVVRRRRLLIDILTSTTVVIGLFSIYIYYSAGLSTAKTIDESLKTIKKENTFLQFSKTANILVLSFDAIQSDLFEQVLEENPHFRDIFDGFTFYSDVAAFSPNTSFSLLSTITGKLIPTGTQGDNIESLTHKISDSNIITLMAGNGYQSDIFGTHFGSSKEPSDGTSYVQRSSLIDGLKDKEGFNPYQVGLYRIAPKSISIKIDEYFQDYDSGADFIENVTSDSKGLNFALDLLVFRVLYENPTLTDKKIFKFSHFLFTHTPFRFTADGEYRRNTPQTYLSAKEEIVFAIKEISRLIDKIKKLGIFDKTFIVIMSDHGYGGYIFPDELEGKAYPGKIRNENGKWSSSRYWPILLIKNFHSLGSMHKENRPASLLDIAPTICEVSSNEHCDQVKFDGVDLLSDKYTNNRPRKIMVFVSGPSDEKEEILNSANYATFGITRNVRYSIPLIMKHNTMGVHYDLVQ